MSKKLLLTFLIGMFLIAACTSNTPEPTQEPNPTEVLTEEPTAEPTEVSIEGDRMPCTTVFDYATDPEIDQYQAVVDQAEPVTEDDWIYGDPDAPITIIEYEDFQCPACPGFSLSVKALIKDFPSIRVVFRHLPLPSIHDKAYISAMAAEAAGAQGKFWEMHDVLYTLQSNWTNMSEDEFVDWVTGKAEELELDIDQFTEDMFDEEARSELEATNVERLSMGFNYTPFVIVNDRIYRNGNPNLFSLVGIYEYDGYEECPPWVIEPEKSYSAVLDTSAGKIEMELYADVAPLAVNNFVFLAQEGWYDGVFFHRVVEEFVAQAGDPSGYGAVGPGYTFANETDNDLVYDEAGILGMANSGADRNGSQFFITLGPTPDLNGGYTIFGKVKEDSLAVLDEIALRDPNTATDFEGATIINGVEIIEN